MTMETATKRGPLSELLFYFLRLGLLGFGGPVALVGQMERELVAERGWLTKEQMWEAIAICQSLPGPLAIQVGIYISYLRGGFWGAWIGGWAFIFPNFVIVAALGALYVYFSDLKPITGIFYGVSPAVIALILHSCWRLSKLGMEDKLQWAVAAACLVVTVILQAEVALLFIGAGQPAFGHWPRQNNVTGSLRLDIRGLDHLGPLLGFRGYEFAELSGRHRHRHSA
jgi:chromate transporter